MKRILDNVTFLLVCIIFITSCAQMPTLDNKIFDVEFQLSRENPKEIIAKDDTCHLGQVAARSQGMTTVFTIKNNVTVSGLNLMLNGEPTIELTDDVDNNFSLVTDEIITSLGAGEETSFSLVFTPQTAGIKSATIIIRNNDSDFSFKVQAQCIDSTVTLIKDDKTVFDNGILTISEDPAVSQQLWIENSGTETLTLNADNPVTITGQDADEFHVTNPTMTSLLPGEKIDFYVAFSPTSTGEKNARLTINSINTSFSKAEFALYCSGVSIEVSLLYNSETLTNNGSFSVTGDSSTDTVLTLKNNGYISVLPAVVLTGTNKDDFVIKSTDPTTDLLPDATIDIIISRAPGAVGENEANLIIKDMNNQVLFMITLISGGEKPGIEIIPNSTGVIYKDSTIEIPENGEETFLIRNVGFAILDLTGDPLVSIIGRDKADFSVKTLPSASIKPNNSTSFVITCTPQSIGTKEATLVIPNNDSLVSIPVSFKGITPEILLRHNSKDVVNKDAIWFTQKGDVEELQFVLTNTGTIAITPFVTVNASNDYTHNFTPDTVLNPGESVNFSIFSKNLTDTIEYCIVDVGYKTEHEDISLRNFTLNRQIVTAGPQITLKDDDDVMLSSFVPLVIDNSVYQATYVKNIRILNTGGSDMKIDQITMSSTYPTELKVDLSEMSAFPATLKAGEEVTAKIILTPKTESAKMGTFAIFSNAENMPVFTLSVSTGEFYATSKLSDSDGVFIDNLVTRKMNTVSYAPTHLFPVTITNDGNFPLTLDTVTFDGEDMAEFSYDNVDPVIVNPDAPEIINIGMTPAKIGVKDATCHVRFTNGDTHIFKLTTDFHEPVLVIKDSLDNIIDPAVYFDAFGHCLESQLKTVINTQYFTLHNTGNYPFYFADGVEKISKTGSDFIVNTALLADAIIPDMTADNEFSIAFKPVGTKRRDSTVTVNHANTYAKNFLIRGRVYPKTKVYSKTYTSGSGTYSCKTSGISTADYNRLVNVSADYTVVGGGGGGGKAYVKIIFFGDNSGGGGGAGEVKTVKGNSIAKDTVMKYKVGSGGANYSNGTDSYLTIGNTSYLALAGKAGGNATLSSPGKGGAGGGGKHNGKDGVYYKYVKGTPGGYGGDNGSGYGKGGNGALLVAKGAYPSQNGAVIISWFGYLIID